MYRKTSKAKKYELMRKAKERKRMERDPPDYPKELPELRKKIIVTNYDFGEEVRIFELMKSGRIDQYRVLVDGELWHKQIGLSGIFAGMRKAMPRVRAIT